MRFLYGGEMPEVYCFGLEQLPNKGDIVFITGGEKDVMSLYSKGFFAVCFNSETASIPTTMIEMLERKFRHIIILYDSDETGKRESLRHYNALSDHNVIRLELPLSGSKRKRIYRISLPLVKVHQIYGNLSQIHWKTIFSYTHVTQIMRNGL